jgi:hypothetical protein
MNCLGVFIFQKPIKVIHNLPFLHQFFLNLRLLERKVAENKKKYPFLDSIIVEDIRIDEKKEDLKLN